MSDRGVSLIETMIAMLVLTVGAIGMASVFLYGMQSASSSPAELIATQKASEAMESVIAARDSHTLTWAQLRNAADGGIFLDGPKPMTVAGPDGILNTADDGDVETVVFPGPDQTLETEDDRTETLTAFTREITIAQISASLRSITVTIVYQAGSASRTYTLTSYMSAFS
jgi:hypothetical protein